MNGEILSKLTTVCPFPEVFEDKVKRTDSGMVYPRSNIGHIRADHNGWHWSNTVWPVNDELATPEMKREIDRVYDALISESAFPDLDAVILYCTNHPEAKTKGSDSEYNFYFTGDLCNYWIRFITRRKDYNLYLSFYVKNDLKKSKE